MLLINLIAPFPWFHTLESGVMTNWGCTGRSLKSTVVSCSSFIIVISNKIRLLLFTSFSTPFTNPITLYNRSNQTLLHCFYTQQNQKYNNLYTYAPKETGPGCVSTTEAAIANAPPDVDIRVEERSYSGVAGNDDASFYHRDNRGLNII